MSALEHARRLDELERRQGSTDGKLEELGDAIAELVATIRELELERIVRRRVRQELEHRAGRVFTRWQKIGIGVAIAAAGADAVNGLVHVIAGAVG